MGGIRVFVVNEISEARGVDDVETQTNAVFLNIGGDSTDIDGLGDFDGSRPIAVFRRIQTRIEQRVDQRRFSKSTLSCVH